jgi:hypothetical protein
VIERHQDYLLIVPSLPVGGLTQVPLPLDTDAPFALRLVKSRNIGLNGWRFQNPKGRYQSNALRTDWIVQVNRFAAGPFPSRGSIIYEEMIYPPGGTINVDIGNATDEPITNAQLLFRGSKLFKDASMASPTYPERMAVLPAVYQVIVPQVPVVGQRLTNQLTILNDADFVYRWGVCDAFTVATVGVTPSAAQFQFSNVTVQLYDESRKFYSNAPIHVNDLFGVGLPTPNGTGTNDDQVLFTPGLITPEIYLPRRHSLYFDVYRNDASLEGAVPVDLYFRFGGMKVFQR